MKKKFQDLSVLQTFLIVTAIFLVIVVLIEFFYALSKVSFDEALIGLSDPKYLLRKVIGGIIYGAIMTFYFKRKQKKNQTN